MKVCVQGLWHLGTVTAACLAKAGHDVVGLDGDTAVVAGLAAGKPPIAEPGLDDLVKAGLAAGNLRFTSDAAAALKDADVLWVAFDTPVDDEDRADVSFVEERVKAVFPFLAPGALVLVSSQVPVGTTAGLEKAFKGSHPGKDVSFACSPENLRLGKAIQVFMEPDRVVVGLRSSAEKEKVSALLKPITARIEWMSVESAEMTKHAINAFLATSVAFMNELSVLCEASGADAKEVERGLKSESRIGPKAYLAPGGAIGGGTLARDLRFLSGIGRRTNRATHLIEGVLSANELHKGWAARRLSARLADLNGKRVGVLGLTYKPGTDTLRRSGAVELCLWLAGKGAVVIAHDPAVKSLPEDLKSKIRLADTPQDLLKGAEAVVVATEWPAYKDIKADEVVGNMKTPLVVDPNRFLSATLGGDSRLAYDAVGVPR
jgi:UDPglucose 6-dehydrogenase